MKNLLLLSLLTFSSLLYAAPPVTHQFTNGTTIEASQVNSNYQELADRIEAADVSINIQGLSTDVGVLQGQVLQLQNALAGLSIQNNKQLVGFTSVAFTQGGVFNNLDNIALCQSEFPGSTLCTVDDIYNTTLLPLLPTSSAGLAFLRNSSGGARTPYCVNSKGDIDAGGIGAASCSINTKLACCK